MPRRPVTASKRLARPQPAAVRTGPAGVPVAVGRLRVESVLEDWLVEDRWWTGRPLRRRYLEVVLENGRCLVVFRSLRDDRWFSQSG
jgi:hypothetical protein